MGLGPERLRLVREALQGAGLDGLVVRLPENVVLATGVWPANGLTVAVIGSTVQATLLLPDGEIRYTDQGWAEDVRSYSWGRLTDPDPWDSLTCLLRDWFAAHGLARGRIGCEGMAESIAPPFWAAEPVCATQATRDRWERICPNACWVEATAILDGLRSRKTPEEVRRIRLANEVAGLGTTAFREAILPGKRECEVAAAVERAVYADGPGYHGMVRRARAWAHVVSGERTLEGWRPFTVSTDRRLLPGDLVLLELAVVTDGYWSDLTRVHVVGAPARRQRQAFTAVQRANAAARAALQPGVMASDVDAAARQVLESEGLGHGFLHHTGHGTGFKYHEAMPKLCPGSRDIIEPGMITTIEAGIYLPELGGIRIEENHAVSNTGSITLSPEQGELAT